jgi:hypothetical protein
MLWHSRILPGRKGQHVKVESAVRNNLERGFDPDGDEHNAGIKVLAAYFSSSWRDQTPPDYHKASVKKLVKLNLGSVAAHSRRDEASVCEKNDHD